MQILAFEPFDTGSHRQVRESISRHSSHNWTWLTRPGRAWKWRMRTAAIEMIDDARQVGLLDQRWDAIFVTSLMSAADLRAMLPPPLRTTPLVLYLHENQATYPAGDSGSPHNVPAGGRDVHFALTNLTSTLAADRVIWNSRWNRDSFVVGLRTILKNAPDASINIEALLGAIEDQIVIWPPVEPPPNPTPNVEKSSHVKVVWPHRWEHDKGPDELLEIARRHTESLNLRWTILGEGYRTVPDALQQFEREFGPNGLKTIDHFGFEPDRSRYWQHLQDCDWVLSTARHEFFGIAVVEALMAGCLPWLPERLSYPEITPVETHGLSPAYPPRDVAATRSSIHQHLAPALAANAVGQLDGVFDACLAGRNPCRAANTSNVC